MSSMLFKRLKRQGCIVLLLIAPAWLGSCSSAKKEYVSAIKMLEIKVDSISEVYAEIDIEYFVEIQKIVQANMIFVQGNAEVVDMDDDTVALYIGAYGSLWKTMNRTFKHGGASLDKDIHECKLQLSHLKHDIRKGLLTDIALITSYIRKEREAVEKTKYIVEKTVLEFGTQKRIFMKLNEKVDSILYKSAS